MKILKYLLAVLKGIAIILGSPILLWLLYIAIISFGNIGEDISQQDFGYHVELKKMAKEHTIPQRPNILLILADDLGYGDLSCYGSSAIRTPNIDSLAKSGMKFTQFYSGSSVCSPARAALMTGRYPIRAGFSSVITPTALPYGKKVMWHISKVFNFLGSVDMGKSSKYNGLSHKEITIAEALKQAGYTTGMSGKWHLGDLKTHPEFNPMHHGFDDFLGLNAANDEFPAALFDRDSLLTEDVGLDQDYLTRIFAKRTIEFINQNAEQPFFYFLSFTAPHLPLVPSEDFKNKSKAGIYGNVVEEMDFYVGEVIAALQENGLADNTIIIFTSDNGPWFKGSTGNFRGRKGQSFEGGYRVPFIVSWPDHIPENTVCKAASMNFDVYPTLLQLAGLETPQDREIDGKNMLSLWTQKDTVSQHAYLFFYHFNEVEAVLAGNWKYLDNTNHYVWPILLDREGLITHDFAKPWFGIQHPNLYNLALDESENYDLQHHYTEIADSLSLLIQNWNELIADNPEGWK